MNAEGQEEKRLFEEAIELSVEERVGYLKGACRDRPEMFDRVLGLLEAYSDESPVLPSMLDEETIGNPVTEQLGTTIGRYKLLEQIGEGGMGVVYMAEQSKPVVRKVALKIIKLGLRSMCSGI